MAKKISSIASRKLFIFNSPNDKVEVIVGLPTSDKEFDVFTCPFQIWFNSELIKDGHMYGDDSVQALIQTLQIIGTFLNILNDDRFCGRLRQWPNEIEPDKYFGFLPPRKTPRTPDE